MLPNRKNHSLHHRLNRRRFLQLSGMTAAGLALGACTPAGQPAAGGAAATTGFQGTVEFWDWAHEPRVLFT